MLRIARSAVVATVVVAAFAVPAAHGATLSIKQKCAVSRDSNGTGVEISGTGLSSPPGLAGVRVTAFRGGQQLGGANYATSGGNLGPINFGLLGLSKGEAAIRLDAVDSDGNRASATTMEAAFGAAIQPKTNRSRPKPRRSATISLGGWLGKTVYAHFIPPFPATKSKVTAKVGKTQGVCGHLTKHVTHLFPFTPRPGGTWQVIFDTKVGNINFNNAYRAKGYRLPNGQLNPDYPQYVAIYESVPFS
jgi:hypothetical protein